MNRAYLDGKLLKIVGHILLKEIALNLKYIATNNL